MQAIQGERKRARRIGGKVDRMRADDRMEVLRQTVRIRALGFDQLVDPGCDHARDRDLLVAGAKKVPVPLKAVRHRIQRYETERLRSSLERIARGLPVTAADIQHVTPGR